MKCKIIYFLALILILAACRSGKPVSIKYYTLEYPGEKISEDTLKVLPFSVELAEVEVNRAVSSHQIAVRENTNEIRYFSHSQWAVRPDQGIEHFIQEYFNRNNIFSQAGSRFWNINVNYRLQTVVHHLEVVHDRRDYKARLQVEFRLYDAEEETLAVSHLADKERLLPRRNLNLFADAISNILYEELHYFAQKVQFELADE